MDAGGSLDTVQVVASAGNDRIRVAQGGSGIAAEVFANGTRVKWVPIDFLNGESLVVEGGLSNDQLDVDNTNGLVILTLGTTFHGGDGDDSLLLRGTLAIDSAIYNVGPERRRGNRPAPARRANADRPLHRPGTGDRPGRGRLADRQRHQRRQRHHLHAGPNSGVVNAVNPAGLLTGLVAVDGFETFEFANKTTLTINGLGGDDTIQVRNDGTPTGLTGVTVNGQDGADTVRAVGTLGLDQIGFNPTSFDRATLTINALPTLTIQTTEGVAIDGQAGDDVLTITTLEGRDEMVLSSGPLTDSGTLTLFSNSTLTSFVPLAFSNLGSGGELVFEDTIVGLPAIPLDILTVVGTSSDDSYLVTTDFATGQNQVFFNSQPKITAPGVVGVVLDGRGGNDDFSIDPDFNPILFQGITILGGEGDDSVFFETLDGAVGTVTISRFGSSRLFVNNGGIVSAELNDVEDFEIDNTNPVVPLPIVVRGTFRDTPEIFEATPLTETDVILTAGASPTFCASPPRARSRSPRAPPATATRSSSTRPRPATSST